MWCSKHRKDTSIHVIVRIAFRRKIYNCRFVIGIFTVLFDFLQNLAGLDRAIKGTISKAKLLQEGLLQGRLGLARRPANREDGLVQGNRGQEDQATGTLARMVRPRETL